MKKLTEKLYENRDLSDIEFYEILSSDKYDLELRIFADEVRKKYYSNKIFIRGLIEISNICKNNCYYCGLRAKNTCVERYRLDKSMIMNCCRSGYEFGFRTFVLQSGEDLFFNDEYMCDVISQIKKSYPDCAVTLSLGERSAESYEKLFKSGADRYLLRHETASRSHYEKLHPEEMKLENRKKCLYDLKKIGYQVGSGFMVGSPFQTTENIIEDLRFLQELRPDMIGIGPFIAHKDTCFSSHSNGSVKLTLRLISVLRLMFPLSLIPSTTALATLSRTGREEGIKSGANVVMPNLSPENVRDLYSIYNKKSHSGSEAAEGIELLKKNMEKIGYEIVTDRGDVIREEVSY